MADAKRFVGVDVAKAQLDVAIAPDGENFSIANDENGIRELLKRLGPGAELVILEATALASALATGTSRPPCWIVAVVAAGIGNSCC